MRPLAYILLVAWGLTGIYFGVGSMIYENSQDMYYKRAALPYDASDTSEVLNFKNKRAYELNKLKEDITRWENLLVWANKFPAIVNLLIGSSAFCVIGVLIGILKRKIVDNELQETPYIITAPFLGALTGFVVLSLDYLIPTLLTEDSTKIKPIPLMLLSVLVGIFMKEFYIKVSNYFTTKILKE